MAATLLTAVSATLALAPLLFADLVVDNEDFRVHFGWVRQWTDAWQVGDYYPRWMPLANGGLGEPAFEYYPPLFHATSTALGFLLSDFWRGMKATVWLACWASGRLTFRWIRSTKSFWWAMLAAVALQTAPFAVFVEVRLNAWPWYSALPFLLLFLRRSLRQNPRFDLVAAAALAGLVLSHILTAFLALVCLPLAVPRQRLLGWFTSVAAGLALAGFYLYPALTTLDWISPQGWVEADFRDWRNRFVFPVVGRLLGRPEATAYQWLVPLAVLLATLALVWFWRTADRQSREPLGRLLTVAAFAWFFATELSYPLWATLPGFELVQFPFRFLYVAGAASLVGVALAAHRYTSVALGISIAVGLALGAYGSFAVGRPAPLELATATSYPGRPEYLPATAGQGWNAYVEDNQWTKDCPDCSMTRTTGGFRFEVSGVDPKLPLRLPVFDFPRWVVTVDGEPATKRKDPATGVIAVSLPSSGRHTVELQLAL